MSDNIVKTSYGYEVIWADNEHYCSKILVFENQNEKIPLHFHKNKHKSWFVNAGKFEVQWVDTNNGNAYLKELPEGSLFDVPPLMPVTLKSLIPNSAMAETSSNNDVEDYFKLG